MGIPRFNDTNSVQMPRKVSRNVILRLKKPLTPVATRVPRIKLNGSSSMPAFGVGTWKSKSEKVYQAVKDAIDAGYRYFDCAYCDHEEAIGKAIHEKIQEGIIKREDVFIVSKNAFHSPAMIETGVRNSLKALGLEYLDAFLIQYPTDRNGHILDLSCDIWKVLEALVHNGLVKSIGVLNFNQEKLEELLKTASILPVINQIEVNPYLTKRDLVDFCQKRNIEISAYNPLGSKDGFRQDETTFLQDPNLMEIARKYNKTIPQIILRWLIQRGVAVVPKLTNKVEMIDNYNIFDFYLSNDDMEAIFSLNRNRQPEEPMSL